MSWRFTGVFLRICVGGWALSSALALWAAQPASTLPTLTRADQVRHLTPDQAKLGYPVRIRGVITGDVPAPDFFIQDPTAGVYVEGNHAPVFSHVLGQEVELEGVTGPGKFAPVIRERQLRVRGKGRLPGARLYAFSELADGQQDSQWAKIRGIVRSVSIDRESWPEMTLAMNIASGGGQFKVRVPITEVLDFSSWIDSAVLIEGVCGSLFNRDRQLMGVLFYVPRLSFIKKEAPAQEVPFVSLLRFSPRQGPRQRVRVRGVVAYQQPGNALFLESDEKGLRVLTEQDTHLEIGDVIDVLGFPAVGESAPVLQDAVFHRIGHQAPPLPSALDLSTPWERYDGALVVTDARLLQREIRPDGITLVLQRDDTIFNANLTGLAYDSPPASIPLNSDVRVTGICLVRNGGLWRVPQSFRLLLRSPADIAVLRKPSWWNLRHALWLLGITAGILLIVMAWVVVLGKRLRAQMAIIRQKLRSGAVLEERNRIARELHDTLEQELVGITMQLDLAADCFDKAPDIARRATDTARNMSRHSMLAARRSVWDLRCHLLETGDLESAFKQVIASLATPNQLQIEMQVSGEPTRLSAATEMNLLRIGQEAITNAVRHGHAHNIAMQLQYGPQNVRLCVTDDGKGFSAEEMAFAGNGHFGLLDMRERAQSLGSSLKITSAPGKGTRIEVKVQTSSSQSADEELKAHTYSGRG